MDSPVMLSKIAGWKLSLSICSSIAVGCAGLQEISDSLSWCIINGYISRLRRPVAELLDKSFKGALTLPSIIILEKLRAVEASSAVSLFGGWELASDFCRVLPSLRRFEISPFSQRLSTAYMSSIALFFFVVVSYFYHTGVLFFQCLYFERLYIYRFFAHSN